MRDFVGRPSPLYPAPNLSRAYGGAPIALKREDLNHTGAHKINNTVGQALLAARMKKRRLIAETGAGQHGVATATVGAKFGLPVDVYMGAVDVARQELNVFIMELLGATVHPVAGGTQTLKDATNEAFRQWAGRADDTFYVIGSVVGAHPYPYMVREFQRVIGDEARAQCLERYGRLPSDVIACIGGGSNAIGIFSAFLGDAGVRSGASRPAATAPIRQERPRLSRPGASASCTGRVRCSCRRPRVRCAKRIQSARVWTIQASARNTRTSRKPDARPTPVTDREALAAFCSSREPKASFPPWKARTRWRFREQSALERSAEDLIVVNVSGRGDKDLAQIRATPG